MNDDNNNADLAEGTFAEGHAAGMYDAGYRVGARDAREGKEYDDSATGDQRYQDGYRDGFENGQALKAAVAKGSADG